ncbi:hypothetical protein SAMN04487770_1638 [Butyrivibrio sp. ob235]|nr:hypothetical protein SAMN04487770_1638 [Butyrivibrio sp. ob235]
MDDKDVITVFQHESELYRLERFNKRITAVCVIQTILFFIYIVISC